MKFDITKSCADSLRAQIQNNYGIQLKSSHAHEIVAAFLGYSSRAALLADDDFSISKLSDADAIILNHSTQLVDQRLKILENLPLDLPTSDILAEGVYAPIIGYEQFSGKIWPSFHEVAIAISDERAFENLRMMGMNPKELDWIIDTVVKAEKSVVQITVTFDYPANAKKLLRHASVAITLPRIAGCIGFSEPKVLPTFYHGNMTDPDFRLKYEIA